MAKNFMDSNWYAPGGKTWREICEPVEPQLDGRGLLADPWGACIRAAVTYETQQQQGQFSDMPAGQVIDFFSELGHDPFVDAANKTEQAAHQSPMAQVIGAVSAPFQQSMGGGGGGGPIGELQPGYAGMAQILAPHQSVEVRQINFSGADCCCCMRKEPCKGFPCCCCQSTSEFEISANDEPILIAWERSGVWERVCCSPGHALTMKVVSASGGPGLKTKYIDADEIEEEFANVPKLLTLERKGCSNCYCVQCFSCCPCCNDNLAVYEGDVQGTAGSLENPPKMMTMMSQPIGGGIFTPTIDIEPKEQGAGGPMKVTGPCIFGGWSEICCHQNFQVANSNGDNVAEIKHLKPEGCCEYCMAFATPLDRYQVTFNKGDLEGVDKANVILSSLLVDYMFFEMDEGPCSCTPDYIKCTFFFCNCCGCLCPCDIKIYKQGEGEGGDGE